MDSTYDGPATLVPIGGTTAPLTVRLWSVNADAARGAWTLGRRHPGGVDGQPLPRPIFSSGTESLVLRLPDGSGAGSRSTPTTPRVRPGPGQGRGPTAGFLAASGRPEPARLTGLTRPRGGAKVRAFALPADQAEELDRAGAGGPNQCGVRVSNSAASPRVRRSLCSPRTSRSVPLST